MWVFILNVSMGICVFLGTGTIYTWDMVCLLAGDISFWSIEGEDFCNLSISSPTG